VYIGSIGTGSTLKTVVEQRRQIRDCRSISDFGQAENCVRFFNLKPGSPAATAELKAGDRRVEFAAGSIKPPRFTTQCGAARLATWLKRRFCANGQPVTASAKLEAWN